MRPLAFRYMDLVAKLARSMGTRDVLHFDHRLPAEPADLVVATLPPKDERVLDGVCALMRRMAVFIVEGEWSEFLATRFRIVYADPGHGYCIYFVEAKTSDDAEVALYDLSERPATFDILPWLSLAQTFGAKHVRFVLDNGWKKKNYSVEQAQARFESIVKPAVELFGVHYSIGEPVGVVYQHTTDGIIRAFESLQRVSKIPVTGTPKDYVTITLRKSRTSQRDSNEAEWMKFAKRCKDQVLIIRDYDDEPVSLAYRMELYANAKMNFFVNNGPAMLCILSDAPYLVMHYICGDDCKAASPKMMAEMGITPGFQYPWAHANQRLSYLWDTCENIEHEWALMREPERLAA